MKPPRFVLYAPRPVSYRGYMIVGWMLWVAYANAVIITVFILWAAVWLIWILLAVLPRRIIVGIREGIYNRRLGAAEDRMRAYVRSND